MRNVGIIVLFVLVASCAPTDDTVPAPTQPAATAPSATPAERQDERAEMVEKQIEGRAVSDPLVLEAMREVPRHRFVPDDLQDQAYWDNPLPIGHGQTISQPYIVALMSEALAVEPGDRVLEIGTGSGYQAAVLAEMGVEVYTIEIIPELTERARATLAELGYEAEVLQGDGYFGYSEAAPFDAIIVTAAPDHVPQPLVQQLDVGGRMVIPVGPIGAVQTLWRFTVDTDGEVMASNLGQVRFVPFTRSDG